MQNLAFRDKKCQLINPDAILITEERGEKNEQDFSICSQVAVLLW